MIESLTSKQIAKFDTYRQKWINIGLSTEPLDFKKAKKAAQLAYKQAGLICPKNFHVADSPYHAFTIISELYPNIDNSSDILSTMMFGNQEASWLSYYDFCETELGIKNCKVLKGLSDLAKVCGWWSAFEDNVVFQHRPLEIHIDDSGRLHNTDGPAIKYRDNYCLWAIEGNTVTEQIVMSPETLTISQIHKENNADIRAIMISRRGWVAYIEETNSRLIDFRDNNVEGTKEALYSTEMYGKRLVATCATGRIFVMGVPNEIDDCVTAQKWLWGNKKVNVIGRT